MKLTLGVLAAACFITSPALAQRGGGHGDDRRRDPPPPPPQGVATPRRADEGRRFVPDRGPVAEPMRRPDDRRRTVVVEPGPRGIQRFDRVSGRWIGHEYVRTDVRFHLSHPWAWGRFPGRIGPDVSWHLRGGGPGRFFVGAGYFRVARWEYVYANDWLWDSDDICIFDEPDADGWYIAYNPRLGTYVHVIYVGAP